MTQTQQTSMQAVIQREYGGPETLQYGPAERPEPAETEVLVKVLAAGVDRGTWHLMTGKPYLARLAFGLRRPKNPIPGCDVAGEVVSIGTGVTGFAVGDHVYGISKAAYAEFALVPEPKLVHKPESISFVQAAVVPISGVTALQGLTDVGRVEKGQRVLILGASGGVGSIAVQLAVALGAEVTASASTVKLDFVRSLGAEHVIDYTHTDFADETARYDLILDLAGNPSLARLRRALTPHGTAVIGGGEEGGNFSGGMNRQLRAGLLSPFIGQRLTGLLGKERGSDLVRLNAFIQAGTFVPQVDRTFPLAQTADALHYLAAGRVRGKVAITI